MLVGKWCRDASAGRAHYEPRLQQERLIDVLDRLWLLPDAHRQGRQPDGPAGEADAEDVEDLEVEAVQPELVDSEDRQAFTRCFLGDHAFAPDLDEVADAP